MIKGYEETGRLLARRDTLNTLRNIESINSIDCSVILRMAESHTERQTITGGYIDLSTVTEALQAAVDKELEIVSKQLLDAGIRG